MQVGVALSGLLFLNSSSSGDQGGLDFEPWGTAAALLFVWGIVRSEVLAAKEGPNTVTFKRSKTHGVNSTPFQRPFNTISTPFQRPFNALSTPFQHPFNTLPTIFLLHCNVILWISHVALCVSKVSNVRRLCLAAGVVAKARIAAVQTSATVGSRPIL